MNTAPTALDSVAAILIVLMVLVSALTLLGMASLMAMGAMTTRSPVSSWPTDQEQAFASFERSGAVSNTRAWMYSFVGAVVITIFACFVYFGVEPEKKDIAKDMNMSNLTKKRGPVAPKPDPAQAKPDSAPAEAPKPDTEAPATPEK